MCKKNTAVARIELPPRLIPVFSGKARYRGAYGGRGSGKTRSFAKMAVVKGYQLSMAGREGMIACAREYRNALGDSTLPEIKAAIAAEPWLARHYDVGEKYIRTKDGRIAFAFIGLRHSLDSIKSKARIHLLWVDEAEPVSETAWLKAIPTVREPDSEIWVTWNPESRNSATHKRFRENPPQDARIAEISWRDNPWFPQVLNRTRLEDLEKRPEHYAHIWEGDFVTAVEGAYYAGALIKARQEGRIAHVAADPLMTYRAFWDIGGTGAKADATAIWMAQFVDREIRVVDYYEARGQPLVSHIQWLREQGYGAAQMVLPHDGLARDRVHDVSFESMLRDAGFAVEIVPNQGPGAARMRIEAARRLFSSVWFDEKACRPGLEALSWYHEKRDENRNIGLGPAHDWSSHAADAFGLMCVAYEQPSLNRQCGRYHKRKFGNTSWMAG